ncbi:MAG TPA: hypothetical protein VFU21_12880 [Kofleriaceae bacterium]|nr:hypothetical protein [Kofleriaceae bacterium]
MMVIGGGCHCGNISFQLDWHGDPEAIPARACGCSFCVKHRGVWTSEPRSSLAVEIGDPALATTYSFATGTAAFHVCARCGVVPLVTCKMGGRLYAVVNVNTLEGVDPSILELAEADFEGEDLETRLARRRRNWIPSVSVRAR